MTFSRGLKRPDLKHWRQWQYADYLAYFLSAAAMQRRLRVDVSPAAALSADEFTEFCRPIRDRIQQLFSAPAPRVAITLPAYNEEVELLPTLVSLTCLRVPDGGAEVVVADNRSTDRTAAIINNCGAKYVWCETPGVGYCRQAAYSAISPSAEYVWLTDADSRVIPPLRSSADLTATSTILETSVRYLDANEVVLGISTGGVPEGGHWMYMGARRLSVACGRSKPYSCWAGYNQFVRRWALDEIGGIDPTVEFGDDHFRHYELARLGKRLKKQLHSAHSHAALCDPVYYSGRRYATLKLLIQHGREVRQRPTLPKDEYGYPIHPRNVPWRQIRNADSQ